MLYHDYSRPGQVRTYLVAGCLMEGYRPHVLESSKDKAWWRSIGPGQPLLLGLLTSLSISAILPQYAGGHEGVLS